MVDTADMLINAGCDMNAVSMQMLTPMELAIQWNHVEIASLLVNRGCLVIVKGSHENKSLIQSIFLHCGGEKAQFACKIQQKYWEEIANEIKHMKTVSSHTKYSKYHYLVDLGHHDMLKQWYDTIQVVTFEDMMKAPEFLCTELDAAIKYRSVEKMTIDKNDYLDTDEKKSDYYYQAYYTIMEDEAYHVSYDLIDQSAYIDSTKKSRSTTGKSYHPLAIIAKHDNRMLLNHPVVRMLMRKKWSFALIMYIPFLIFFLMYTVLLTVYMANIPFNITAITQSATVPQTTCSGVTHSYTLVVFMLCFATVGIISEIIQIWRKRQAYFYLNSGEIIHNVIDWFCYMSGILIVIAPLQDRCVVFGDWVWTVGILAVLVSLIKFVQLTRIIPFLGVYVVMVEMIFISFLQFCIVFSLYLLSFAICFHLVVPQHTGFLDVGYSFVTTWVMMVGEMNYDSLVDKESLLGHEWVIYFIFVCFLICLSLIVMNLLTGIAVSDVQKLTEESTYGILKMQIEYSLSAEKIYELLHLGKLNCNSLCKPKDKSLQNSRQRITLEDCDFITQLPPPIDSHYEIISNDTSSNIGILQMFDTFFYGPLNKEYCMTELKRVKESKKDFWYVVPNIEWRKDLQTMTQDTTKALEHLKKDNDQLRKKLEKQSAETNERLEKIETETHDILSLLRGRNK